LVVAMCFYGHFSHFMEITVFLYMVKIILMIKAKNCIWKKRLREGGLSTYMNHIRLINIIYSKFKFQVLLKVNCITFKYPFISKSLRELWG